jgi:hypothetical protein
MQLPSNPAQPLAAPESRRSAVRKSAHKLPPVAKTKLNPVAHAAQEQCIARTAQPASQPNYLDFGHKTRQPEIVDRRLIQAAEFKII